MRITIQRNGVGEIRLNSMASYEDPYNEVEVHAVFQSADGATWQVPAFWAGDNLWGLRFAADKPGAYAFETFCTNRDDRGLHGVSGTVAVIPYSGTNPLLRHGRLRVAADARHFIHADGTPFLWVGDTWWMGFTDRLDWPHGFASLAMDRVKKGFKVVQIIAGPLPDMDAWDPRGRNEGGFPFREGFAGINPAFFDQADVKVGHLVHVGLMPCLVGMWGYYLPQIGEERIKRFWRYLVARYGAYPVVWCLAGEGTMPYYLSKTPEEDSVRQRKGWSEVAAHVREVDPFHNLITIHPTRYGREMVEDPSLLDFEMLQTGHGGLKDIPTLVKSVTESLRREPKMPVIVGESNYEGILGSSWQDVQRLGFYGAVFSGAAGYTYGANGLWQASLRERPYGPSPHGRCWGNTPWQEAAQLPGSTQVGLGGRFLAEFPWWDFERCPDWVATSAAETDPYSVRSMGIPGRLRLVFVPRLWTAPTIASIEAGVRYRASYFDPCTGSRYELGYATPDKNGSWQPPLPPEVNDWVLVLDARGE